MISGLLAHAIDRTWDVWSFVKWRLSEDLRKTAAGVERYNERQNVCGKCDYLKERDDGKKFCGDCGCKENRWSELGSSKNWRMGHNCPWGKHRDSVAVQRIRNAISASGAGSGCGGGCKGKTNGKSR